MLSGTNGLIKIQPSLVAMRQYCCYFEARFKQDALYIQSIQIVMELKKGRMFINNLTIIAFNIHSIVCVALNNFLHKCNTKPYIHTVKTDRER